MDLEHHVSLIDLSKQLPFEIDQTIKEEICFGETLIISCGHYEGNHEYEEESSESEWSCEDSAEATVEEEDKVDQMYEIKDYVAEESAHEEEVEEDDDFSFYFFPDCHKPPPPQNSKTSLIVVNGLPKLNPTAKGQKFCVCKKDKTGECLCYMKVPCKCGAKTLADCICSQLKDICVCTGQPRTECKCENCDVCICDPDGRIFPKCTCATIEKPCICHPGKFPSPVCKCKYKPKFVNDIIKTKDKEFMEEGYEVELEDTFHETEVEEGALEEGSIKLIIKEPCVCQKPEPKKLCYCLKGKDCICLTECICGVQRPCLCQPEESEGEKCENIPCKINDETKSTCSCDAPKLCTCKYENTGAACKCFLEQICKCGDPANCKCFTTCDCTNPCICDTVPVKPKECICLKPSGLPDYASTCQCIQESAKTQKKVRAGKDGYRWCHEVTPYHTYFDYAYGKHDKVNSDEAKAEKLGIQGLHDKKPGELSACPVHGEKTPKFEKKPRKPSLDCCSAVGGISICVESLGEDKDKLLVQVVSYSSKEGAKTGSKLVSILDCNLHTMEENRVEHITKKDLTKERRSYLAICESGYYNKVTRICGDKHVVKRLYHSFEMAHNFILEGSNIVFLRYLALRRFKGTVQTDTVMMDGTICRSIYVCKGVSQGIVNGTPFFVVKIERHIVEPSGYVHQTLTVLSLKGYTISHEWADNCYIFHVNPLLRVVPERDEIEQHEPLRETWRNDLQLMSDFLDFKSTRISEGGRYVTESGTLTGTVRDYLQAILLLRPQDTLHFTRHYFGTVLSALDLPHDEFFDPTSKHVRYYFFEE